MRSPARGSAPMGKAEIAVDDADEREVGEVVALGHDLRADDDVDLARLDLVDRCRASR